MGGFNMILKICIILNGVEMVMLVMRARMIIE